MSIKQYGGVFGRNPTFNEIDSDGNANLGDGTLFVDSVNKRVGIDKTNPQYPLDFNTAATGMVARFGDDNVTSYVSFSNPRTFFGYHTGNTMVQSGAGKKIIFYTGSNTAGDATAVAAEFTTAGNLAFPSGQGIDFSATAGTGTSELLDDYEEGTFTPEIADASSGGNTGSAALAEGYYTKVGRLVTIAIALINIDTTGMTAGNNLHVRNLPFSQGAGVDHGSARVNAVTFSGSLSTYCTGTYALVADSVSGASFGYVTVGDCTSGSADIYMSFTYRV